MEENKQETPAAVRPTEDIISLTPPGKSQFTSKKHFSFGYYTTTASNCDLKMLEESLDFPDLSSTTISPTSNSSMQQMLPMHSFMEANLSGLSCKAAKIKPI